MELTYDHEGRMVSPGHRGASLAHIGEGPHARILRGRAGGLEIALKIQKEEAPHPNPQTEERWTREHRALTQFGGEEPGLVSVEPVMGFDEDLPPRFEPLVLCREKGLLFHLPCPRCMRVHVLADCRDDEVLAAAGLPTFSASHERFLWCSACGREEPVFYVRKERTGAGPVKDFGALLDSLRTVVDRGADEDPIPTELLTGLEQDFPCQSCDLRAACYPSGSGQLLAEARILPISLNEFYAWPIPLCQLRYDEAADLLSGANAADLLKRYGRSWSAPALRRMKEDVIAKGAPSDPVEALAAKIDIFAQTVQSAHRLHTMSRQPHLGLSPEHVMVQPGSGGTPLVRVIAPESAPQLRGLRLPPPAPVPPYAAPPLLDGRFGKIYSARIHVEKVWSSAGDTFFAASVEGEGFPSDQVEEKDEILLSLDDAGWEGVQIWCRRLPGDPPPGRLSVVTAPETLDVTQVNDLKAAKGQAPVFGKVAVYRDFGIPFDIHALGMLLFRSVLVNEVQSWERVVEEFVGTVTATFELHAANGRAGSIDAFREALREELTREPSSRLGDRKNVWNRPDEADTARIPEDAWIDLLLLGFRCVTHHKGFSFCETDRDTLEEDPGAPTLTMLGELERIGEIVAQAVLSAPDGEAHSLEDSVLDLTPLTREDLKDITGEVETELKSEVVRLTEEFDRSERARKVLERAWDELYLGVVGLPDRAGPPREEADGRVPLLMATVSESIECITQVFKGIAKISGDELGENVPRIRVLIQDAIRDTEGGKVNVAKKEKQIRRQMRAYRMFLFATVQKFIEANAHSTKAGTKTLFSLMEKSLFEPVMKGRRERAPDEAEIRRRFEQLAKTLPDKHKQIFQPYFQRYLSGELKKLS